MIRPIAIWVLLLFLSAGLARGQDNPYAIHDECYHYFELADKMVGNTENQAFEMANEALLKSAREHGDEKARTLYYVGRLRRASRLGRHSTDRVASNQAVESAFAELVAVSRETGFMQYYYYAYELVQNYYVNTRQESRAQQLMNEMMESALEDNDEYGLWQSQRYLAMLLMRQDDLLNARKHFREVVRVYGNTSDPTILRQSITRTCCDLADTYPVGSDSARFYYKKGEESAHLHSDTLRLLYYKAQLAALDKDRGHYNRYRDACLADPGFPELIRGGKELFSCAEKIIGGAQVGSFSASIDSLQTRQQLLYLRQLAITHERLDMTVWVGTKIILSLYADISRLNDMRLDELSFAYGNSEKAMNTLRETEERQKTALRWLIVFGVLLLVALGGSLLALIQSHFKNKQQSHNL